jgi:hypothetical protein
VLRIDLFILRIVVKFDQLDFERYSDSAFLGNALPELFVLDFEKEGVTVTLFHAVSHPHGKISNKSL